jgi:LPS sulfotransferase NodH
MRDLRAMVLRHQVNCFVILFVERAGSTYLASLLQSHPEIHALREEFAALRQKGTNADEQLAWADAFWTPPLVGYNRAIGFKTKLVDVLDLDGFADLLRKKRCRIIQLQRRNSVKAVVSTINARRLWEASGSWNLLKENDRMPPFAVEPSEFHQLLHQREQWDQQLEGFVRRLELPTLPLYYEELLQNEVDFLKRIFAFLDVKPRPVQGKTFKHTKDNLREVVLNFDALHAHYQGTRYAPMFEEILLQTPSPVASL